MATILNTGNTENVCPIYVQHFSAVILSFQKEVMPATVSFLLMGLTVRANIVFQFCPDPFNWIEICTTGRSQPPLVILLLCPSQHDAYV